MSEILTPFLDDYDVLVYAGDCIEVMAQLPEASVDAIVTDPPYELGFMGKSWDSTGIAYQPETWAAMLRILKPGGHLLAFSATRTYHRMTVAIEDAGFEIRDCIAWMYGSGFPKSLNLDGAHKGWGTALKPAYEPIVVARKPLSGTVAQNVLEHGTGALNIDACRIEGVMDGSWGGTQNTPIGYGSTRATGYQTKQHESGRWPANVALDETAAAMLDAQSGWQKDGTAYLDNRTHDYNATSYKIVDSRSGTRGYGGEGGASRFFYTAKASRKDRNQGGLADNTHPTVKPTELMRWLILLVTPPGGIILDPFGGSGSTGLAARAENTRCILIEREAEYLQIIRDRLAQLNLFTEEHK